MNIEKLENPERLLELNPEKTLEKIGFSKNKVLCDIGAGTGIFTIPAAKMTKKSVFAIDINDKFLSIIQAKAKKENLSNIKTIKAVNNHYDVTENIFDLVILVTVFHEIEDKVSLLSEIKRIMKKTGEIAIIEFHKKQTPIGPPIPHRIGKKTVSSILSSNGFLKTMGFDLGSNFYCVIFKQFKK